MSNTGIVGRTRYLGTGAAGSQPERLANHEQSHIRQIEHIANTLRTEQRGGLRLRAQSHSRERGLGFDKP